MVSPLRRTIYTAVHGLEPAIKDHKVTMIASPLFQETGQAPCDTGLEPNQLAEEMKAKGIAINLDLIVPGWNDKKHGSAYANSSLPNSMRAKLARQFLRDLVRQMIQEGDDSDIAVVSHGGFLHYLTEDWEDSLARDNVSWANTEFRSYQLAQLEPVTSSSSSACSPGIASDKDVQERIALMVKPEVYSENSGLIDFSDDFDNATLVETPESRERRGKSPVSQTERCRHRELWLETISRWEKAHAAAGWQKY